jgi:hypothetical protein
MFTNNAVSCDHNPINFKGLLVWGRSCFYCTIGEGWIPLAAQLPDNAMTNDMKPDSDDRVIGNAEFVPTAVSWIYLVKRNMNWCGNGHP